MRYAKAVTDEREKYRQEQKAICNGRITARSADGTPMSPTQAFEDAQTRYVNACAPIIAQAYHDGDYDGFWQALSNAPLTPTTSSTIKTRPSTLSNKPSY